MRCSNDCFKISSVCDIRQEEGDPRIHYIFIGSSSVCDHGDAGGVLPENVSFFAGSHGIPEIAASAVVVGLHVWKRNTLLSIAAGTVLYMFLIQAVF